MFLNHWTVRFRDFKHEAGLEATWTPVWLVESVHAGGGDRQDWAGTVGCRWREPGLAVWVCTGTDRTGCDTVTVKSQLLLNALRRIKNTDAANSVNDKLYMVSAVHAGNTGKCQEL